jgi:hypothetical protein
MVQATARFEWLVQERSPAATRGFGFVSAGQLPGVSSGPFSPFRRHYFKYSAF